jgi:hypothetical protein
MYVKPKLERFGTLRELTLFGFNENCDGGVIWGIATGVDGSWVCQKDDGRS